MIEPVAGAVELRIRTLLPEQYQYTYEAIQPTPGRSAGLEDDSDGNDAWARRWGSVCEQGVLVERERGNAAGLIVSGWMADVGSRRGNVGEQRAQVDRWRRKLSTGFGLEIGEPVARLVLEPVGPYPAHCAHDVPRFETDPPNLVC